MGALSTNHRSVERFYLRLDCPSIDLQEINSNQGHWSFQTLMFVIVLHVASKNWGTFGASLYVLWLRYCMLFSLRLDPTSTLIDK